MVIEEGCKAMKSEVTFDTSMMQHIDQLKQKTLKTSVAGRTGDYVDSLPEEQPHREVLYEPAQDNDEFLSAIYSSDSIHGTPEEKNNSGRKFQRFKISQCIAQILNLVL